MDADCCLHLYFETAWPSSTINVKSTLYIPCSGLLLCSQDFRLSLYRLPDRHHKRHPKVAATKTLFGSSLYFRKSSVLLEYSELNIFSTWHIYIVLWTFQKPFIRFISCSPNNSGRQSRTLAPSLQRWSGSEQRWTPPSGGAQMLRVVSMQN